MKTMKTMKIIVLTLAFGLFLTSCEKEETIIENKVVGNWKLIEVHVGNEANSISTCNELSTISFRSDNTFYQDYKFLEIGPDCSTDAYNGTWSNVGNDYSLRKDDSTVLETVITIVNNNLQMVYHDDTEGDFTYLYEKM